jgi:hypothetical protein
MRLVTDAMRGGWPKQQWLIQQLREVLRRDFGCQDAWVVAGGDRCRLDVRVDGRLVTLLEDDENAFWAQFYTPVERERLHLGERITEVRQWRRAPAELSAVLLEYWIARFGAPPVGTRRPPRTPRT